MYTVVDLGAGVEPTDIDAKGNVLVHRGVGQSPALVRNGGPVIDIAAAVGVPIYRAFGMNDLGWVAAEGDRGYACHVDDGIARGVPIGLPLAINDAGTVVGKHEGRPVFATLNSPTATPVFTDASAGSALGINQGGTIVGVGFAGSLANQAAWSFSVGPGLRVHATGNPSIATGINAAGVIVGVDDGVGFVIDATGNLSHVTIAGAITSVLDVDDTGRYVGLMSNASLRRGFVGRGAAIQDLTSLVLSSANVVVEMAVAVNEAGWIAATGRIGGEPRGLLLKPLAPGSRFRTLATIVQILVGGRLDEAGIGIGPQGPEPIPPGPLRDGLVGLAIAELAELLDDRGTRAGVRALALERMQVALEHAFAGTGTHARARGACELGSGFPALSEL